jgi:hypothetical protein
LRQKAELHDTVSKGSKMIIKVLALLPGLAAGCPASHVDAAWHSLTPPAAPVYEWPQHQELPVDPEHLPHDGSGESGMFIGMVSNSTVNVSTYSGAIIGVDSGASGSHALPFVPWLTDGLNIVTDFSELGDPFPPMPLPGFKIHIGPNTTKHLSNPSTVRTRRTHPQHRD